MPLNQNVTLEATPELSNLVRTYLAAKAEAAAAKEKQDQLKGMLKALLEPSLDDDNKAVDLVDGDVRVTLKAITSRRLDTARVKAELPTIYEKFSKETVSYQLTDGLS